MNTHHIIDTEDLYGGEPVMLTGEERLLLRRVWSATTNG